MNDKLRDEIIEIRGTILEAQLNAVEADRGIKSPLGEKHYAEKIDSLYMESKVEGWVIEKCEYFGKVCPTSCKEISEIAEGVKACFADEPTRPATQQEVNDGKAVRE